MLFPKKMSGKRDSDPRPQPWQGCALPTELFPQFFLLLRSIPLNASAKVLLFSELPNFSSIFLKKNVHFALFSEQNTHFKPYFADFQTHPAEKSGKMKIILIHPTAIIFVAEIS